MAQDLKKMYKTIVDENFPPKMEIIFVDGDNRQTLFYEKVLWVVDDVQKGLERAKGFLKKELSENLELKYIPDLRFHYDMTEVNGHRIDSLLQKIKKEVPNSF